MCYSIDVSYTLVVGSGALKYIYIRSSDTSTCKHGHCNLWNNRHINRYYISFLHTLGFESIGNFRSFMQQFTEGSASINRRFITFPNDGHIFSSWCFCDCKVKTEYCPIFSSGGKSEGLTLRSLSIAAL